MQKAREWRRANAPNRMICSYFNVCFFRSLRHHCESSKLLSSFINSVRNQWTASYRMLINFKCAQGVRAYSIVPRNVKGRIGVVTNCFVRLPSDCRMSCIVLLQSKSEPIVMNKINWIYELRYNLLLLQMFWIRCDLPVKNTRGVFTQKRGHKLQSIR